MPSHGRPTGAMPQTVIIVQAFEADAEGEVVPATRPRRMADERQAIAHGRELAGRHGGVAAWTLRVSPDADEPGGGEIFFMRGQLPDLDLPVREGAGEEAPVPRPADPSGWMGFRLDKAADWQGFHQAFLRLYHQQPDTDLLAIFTALENRRIVVLPPEAARLVQRAMPQYTLRPCPRPPGSMLSLEVGHRLQLDTGWFELSASERQKRLELAASGSVTSPLAGEGQGGG
jgi:hypothetical protein